MASKEDVETFICGMKEHRHEHFDNDFNKIKFGSLAVLMYLKDNEDKLVKSKDVSDFLNVSTARMTKILKKFHEKDIIKKVVSDQDSRVIYISLTDKGDSFATNAQKQLESNISKAIDEIGMEKLNTTMSTLMKIEKIFYENRLQGDELEW